MPIVTSVTRPWGSSETAQSRARAEEARPRGEGPIAPVHVYAIHSLVCMTAMQQTNT